MSSTDWHSLEAGEVFRKLGTGPDGLTSDQATERLIEYGPNVLEEEERPPLLGTVLHQFKDPLIYILLMAGAITVFLRDYTDAAVIMAVVVLNAVIGFVQEYKAESSIRALAKLLALKALVVRNGYEQELDSETLVPGDLVLLQSGQKIPADLRLIQCKEFQVDESAFTGESVPVRKSAEALPGPSLMPFEKCNMAYMGGAVATGRATGVVVSTGPSTELGQISEQVRGVGRVKTPLQGRVEVLTRYIILGIAVFGTVGLIAGIARGENLLQLALTIIAMAVAAIPEGLPVALTIALAVAVARMARSQAIIRSLPAIETLGSSTVIGSDKTGTLTRNEMTVKAAWAGGRSYVVEGEGYEPSGRVVGRSENDTQGVDGELEWTLRTGLLAGESNLVHEAEGWKAQGDPTEVALIVSARRGGLDEEAERLQYEQLDVLPFESDLQYMATLNRCEDNIYLLVKGAPEKILALTTEMAGMADLPVGEAINAAHGEADRLADQGLRVLGMAIKRMPPGTAEFTHKEVRDLTFLGLQGMMDPPRPEAIEAITDAQASGIRVLMITGDNARTALSIGKIMGIAREGDAVLSGRDLDAYGDEDLRRQVQEVSVFARVSPLHKLRIVNALKSNGEVVAVTGDGVNDAAALKSAHIGTAMGKTGTDVAKEASDMVVVDDNFASIFRAIVEGRVAFDNIRKVTFFLLTTGVGVLGAILITVVTVIPLIFVPAQILWMNLVTNGLQDVALAFDPKEKGVERRRPRNPKEGVLNRTLIIRLVFLGLIVAAGSFGMFVASLSAGASVEHARTIALTTIVFAQFFHVLNSRSERTSVFRQNPVENRFLFASMLAAAVAQMALLYLPAMRTLFKTTALASHELVAAVAVAATVLIGSEIDKWRVRRREGM